MAEKIRPNGLTEKQKLFCEEYVANGYKAIQAYMSAYPDASYQTANGEQWKLLKRDSINNYIKELQHERFEALHINADKIIAELDKIAFADYDDNNSNTSKLKALELLGKTMALYTDKVEQSGETNLVIKITGDDEEETDNESQISKVN